MKIVHIATSLSNPAAGPSYSISRLCENLTALGAETVLHALAPAPKETSQFKAVFHKGYIDKICWSSAMRKALYGEARTSAILHSHSLWRMPNLYPAWATKGTKAKLVVSPRGTLSKDAMLVSKRSKAVLWRLGQEEALRSAHCFHATSEIELADIRRLGFVQPIAVLPNGIDLPTLPAQETRDEFRRILYLGRLHPIKNVDSLIRAWGHVEKDFPRWRLQIAGPDENNFRVQLTELAVTLGIQRIDFLGPKLDSEKWRAYEACDLYVLPSKSENFGITIAEALSSARPVIASKGTPWMELPQKEAGWWVEGHAQSLAVCLSQALALPRAQLTEMGQRGRIWMSEAFSWESIARKMLATYEWLQTGGTVPPWVHIQ